jgi:redox-sensitive bicupin YhaK (pirin superfamily)
MSLIDLTINAREKDLGGFTVRRLLPSRQRQMVGPFIFLDHIGPAQFDAGKGIDVRPHPHIGLSTLTYLFEGKIFHRDSIGSQQGITPGSVNWMIAGRGIAHSERTSPVEREHPHRAHGLQSWIALPKEFEETTPSFHHHEADSLPEFTHEDVSFKLISGKAYGYESPVNVHSPLFYLEVKMPMSSGINLPAEYPERALYLIEGQVKIGGMTLVPGTMLVFERGEMITIEAETASHLMLLGGDPLSEKRYIWWNFVSTSMERIDQAKADWQESRFDKILGDDIEFIPIPEVKP